MYNTNIDTERKYVKIKQDVYEHLARTFLDKNKKKKKRRENKYGLIIGISIFVIFLLVLLIINLTKRKTNIFPKSIYVFQEKEPLNIDYDFSEIGGTKIKSVAINLNNLNLKKYNLLEFSVRAEEKTNIDSTIKIQIENSLLERDAQYISGINYKWKKSSIPFKKFALIKDWSEIKTLSFVVEDWNVSDKKNKIFIDDVRFAEK